MKLDFLDFEQPIAELEAKIEELRHLKGDTALDLVQEISALEAKSKSLTESIFKNLSDVQIAQLSRHPQRPYLLDYIQHIFTDFQELHGDRAFADDKAIVGGLARIEGQPVMVIGQQKGRTTAEKVARNFGMPRPEGYRKALIVQLTVQADTELMSAPAYWMAARYAPSRISGATSSVVHQSPCRDWRA